MGQKQAFLFHLHSGMHVSSSMPAAAILVRKKAAE
jgi:hypothetical protein